MAKKRDRWASDSDESDRSDGEEAEAPAAPPAPPRAAAPRQPPQQLQRRPVKQRRHPLIHGCRRVDCFERLDRIEEGSYGVVYRARDIETREIVALKRVKLTREACVNGFPVTALREANVLLTLAHENIVRVKEMVVGDASDQVFMVMTCFDRDLKSCLRDHEGPLAQADMKCLASQLFAAVAHMHSRWYIHRDIKTSNVLYNDDGRLALCDFGLARRFGDPVEPMTTNVVTLWYRCPELLLGATSYSTAVDNWSVGCVLAELLLKQPVFAGRSEVEQLHAIFKVLGAPSDGYLTELPLADTLLNFGKRRPKNRLREKFPTATFGSTATTPLTASGLDLLQRLFAYDPSSRLGAAQASSHNYFREAPFATPRRYMKLRVEKKVENVAPVIESPPAPENLGM